MDKVIVWTKDELQTLRDHYEKLSREELQRLLPTRKWGSIQQKGEELGIRRGAIRVWWTPEQIDVLKVAYAAGERTDELAARLKHSPTAIKHMAHRLGIGRDIRQIPNVAARRDGASLLGHLSDAERGYIAGLFDGEGCVSVLANGRALQVHISNTDPRVIHWLKERIPSGVINTWQPPNGNKRGYKFHFSTILGAKFCREIYPLLVIKRDEAELVGEALRGGFAPLTQDQRRELRLNLHTLKTTGVPLTPIKPHWSGRP